MLRPSIPSTVAGAFALDGIFVVQPLESYGNENWLVQDGRGFRYVLRRQSLNADPARIEFQFALQQHLAEHALPTSPVVVETTAHRPFAIDDAGVPWILFQHVDGKEYDFQRPAQAAAAARCLARFHLITESFHASGPGPEYRAPIRECWANVERDLAELRTLFGSSCAEELGYLSELWTAVLEEWPLQRFDALPRGWLHGDFHGRNLVFDGDAVAGLFDFDDVSRGPYVHDLAAGMIKFAREARSSLRIRSDMARTFLDGFATVRHITEEERAALPMMAAMGYPPHPQNYRYWRDKRGENIERRFRRDVGTIKALRAEMDRIAPALRT